MNKDTFSENCWDLRDQYFTYHFTEFRLNSQNYNDRFKLMAIRLPELTFSNTKA